MKHGTRIGGKEYGKAIYWADGIADHLIQKYPNKKTFVCASGISPSGAIHFGNFREVITTFAVVQALQDKGKKARFIYSWDNLDRFRKVPTGTNLSYEEYIGKALSDIPAPNDKNISYAEYHQQEFEEALKKFNINPVYKYQTAMYTSGAYDEYIFEALRKRKEIADILLSFMTKKGKKNKGIIDSEYRKAYFPISIYSRFTGKDATEILSYDGEKTVRYHCKITKKEEEIDLSKTHIAKLNWKTDWAMRWKFEDVCFEPGGSDHASPGSSYDVSAAIAQRIFNAEPPIFTEYGFVGIQGASTKMSGSSGKNITSNTLLTIYEPALLLWMYLKRLPSQTFSLTFDTEVYRQYDELDQAFSKNTPNLLARLFQKTSKKDKTEKRITEVIKKIYPNSIYKNPIPFRSITGFGQIVQWDEEKLKKMLKASNLSFNHESITSRLPKAREWLIEYNKEAAIVLSELTGREKWNTVEEKNRQYIQRLHTYLKEHGNTDVAQMEKFIYSLPRKDYTDEKELKKAQRNLFKDIYALLINQDNGPRLSTFLWAIPLERTLLLLSPSKD